MDEFWDNLCMLGVDLQQNYCYFCKVPGFWKYPPSQGDVHKFEGDVHNFEGDVNKFEGDMSTTVQSGKDCSFIKSLASEFFGVVASCTVCTAASLQLFGFNALVILILKSVFKTLLVNFFMNRY